MKWMRQIVALMVLVTAASQAAEPTAKTVRVLTIGNSFSHNATHYLGDLAKAAGCTLVLEEANIGGSSMQQHWDKAVLAEKDPADAKGQYNTHKTLRQHLEALKWDFVTIQQASVKSHDLATYEPYATQLRDYVKRYAPTAELLLHETWAYRLDDPRFKPTNVAPGEPHSQREMYEKLRAAYRATAKELGVRLIPTGDAFWLADQDERWGFKPLGPVDAKQLTTPPVQAHSLHVGWKWKEAKKKEINFDGHHASWAGEYLGACVWVEVMFDRSVVDNTFVPEGFDPAYARFLRETAHRAVRGE